MTPVETSPDATSRVALLPALRERTIDNLWRRAVTARPDGVFLIVEDDQFTYLEAEQHVAATVRVLGPAA